jgi:hypothetical protein
MMIGNAFAPFPSMLRMEHLFDKAFPNGQVRIVPSSDRKNIQQLS